MRGLPWLLLVIFLGFINREELERFTRAFNFEKLDLLKEPVAVLIIVVVAWTLGFLVGRYRRHFRTGEFQNLGEARLSRAVTRRFAPPDYYLLNHSTLRVKRGTTQIDHILVSRFGVFVIETKDYKGWIFANPADSHWTQVLYKVKFRFQNPIRQNYKHVCAVRELLDFLPSDAVRPVVVFTGDAVFKTPLIDGVFRLEGFLDFVAEHSSEVMSTNRLQFCVGRLQTTRLAISKMTDLEHVEALRRRYREDD